MNTKTAAGPVVLVVDDDAMTRILVIEALEPEGRPGPQYKSTSAHARAAGCNTISVRP
jgi:CheY-like chemotaxis protein